MSPSVFDPGLAYTAVAETSLTDVDGERGELVVRGYPIADLAAGATYEEACFLLLRGRLPTADELADFRTDLAAHRTVGPDVVATVRRAAEAGRPATDALRMGLAALDAGDGVAPREAARRVVAGVPTVAATWARVRRGDDPVQPRSDLGHAANYLHLLPGGDPDREPEPAAVEALDALLVTLVDHGLNPSTFAARVVASTGADVVSATTAAVGALNGPRHGGRLEPVFDLFRAAREADDVEAVVRDRVGAGDRESGGNRDWDSGGDRDRESGEDRGPDSSETAVGVDAGDPGAAGAVLPGFGHRVYEVRDPRAAVLAAATARYAEAAGADDAFETARDLETVGRRVLAERSSGATPVPTVEFHVVALLSALGVPPALFVPTFAAARAGGWVAHVVEQRDDDRLLRPTARYVGATDRTWTPVDRRGEADSVLGDAADDDAPPLEPVSETLGVLSDPTRLELLVILADGAEPVAYSTLLSASSVEDKGRLNYHLRRLRGEFVVDGEDGYRLTGTGRRLVRTLVTADGVIEGEGDGAPGARRDADGAGEGQGHADGRPDGDTRGHDGD